MFLRPVQGQWVPEMLRSSPSLSVADSNQLSLRMDMIGFFKNNEYFSPVADGQTLPGVSLLPVLGYQASDKFRAELGAYAVKHSGRAPLSDLQAFVRLQYSITPNFHWIVGNIYGSVNHRLIEPLYQWERHYTSSPESGMQFVLHSDRWFADIWVDWQHFIERGDSLPEQLTFGASASYMLTEPGSKFSLTVPLQLLIFHQGGQIDVSDKPMIVLGNYATGLCSQIQIGRRIQSVGLDMYVAGYLDRYSNEALRPYDNGWGIYPVLHINASPFKLSAGYWYAEKFYGFEGEPLFGSFNHFEPDQQIPKRNLLTLKLAFDKEIAKGIHIGAQIETYSDLNRGETDYSFGVNMLFNKRFLLKR